MSDNEDITYNFSEIEIIKPISSFENFQIKEEDALCNFSTKDKKGKPKEYVISNKNFSVDNGFNVKFLNIKELNYNKIDYIRNPAWYVIIQNAKVEKSSPQKDNGKITTTYKLKISFKGNKEFRFLDKENISISEDGKKILSYINIAEENNKILENFREQYIELIRKVINIFIYGEKNDFIEGTSEDIKAFQNVVKNHAGILNLKPNNNVNIATILNIGETALLSFLNPRESNVKNKVSSCGGIIYDKETKLKKGTFFSATLVIKKIEEIINNNTITTYSLAGGKNIIFSDLSNIEAMKLNSINKSIVDGAGHIKTIFDCRQSVLNGSILDLETLVKMIDKHELTKDEKDNYNRFEFAELNNTVAYIKINLSSISTYSGGISFTSKINELKLYGKQFSEESKDNNVDELIGVYGDLFNED